MNEVPKRRKVTMKDKNGNQYKVPLFTVQASFIFPIDERRYQWQGNRQAI